MGSSPRRQSEEAGSSDRERALGGKSVDHVETTPCGGRASEQLPGAEGTEKLRVVFYKGGCTMHQRSGRDSSRGGSHGLQPLYTSR